MSKKKLSVKQLFDTDVKEYSIYANYRAIPNLMDGFKTSQRKVIYGTLKEGNIPETGMKVSQLAAGISKITAYHHGEGSLEGAITLMAQDFAGSNNVNFLLPLGQFGNRQSNTPASSRYIFTRLAPSFRELFKVEDDIILDNNIEDGELIEPKMYFPILPTVLINGAEGMATGHATNILQYSPEDLKEHVLALLDEKKAKALIPWFRGFKGKIERNGAQTIISGKFEKINSTTIKVTELPIGVYLDAYKAHLTSLEETGLIKDWENHSNNESFEFLLTVPRTTGYEDDETLMKLLKLVAKVKENFTVWKASGDKLKCFATAEDLVAEFVVERLKRYEQRRLMQIAALKAEEPIYVERIKFIKHFLDNAKEVTELFRKTKKADVIEHFLKLGYVNAADHVELRLYTLTADAIEALEEKLKKLRDEISYLEGTNAKEMYKLDLKNLDVKKLLKK